MHTKHLIWAGGIIAPLVAASLLLRDRVGGQAVHAYPTAVAQPLDSPGGMQELQPASEGALERDVLIAAVERIQFEIGDAKDVVSIVRAVAQAQNLVTAVPTLRALADLLEPSLHGIDDKDTACMKAQAAVDVLASRLEARADDE